MKYGGMSRMKRSNVYIFRPQLSSTNSSLWHKPYNQKVITTVNMVTSSYFTPLFLTLSFLLCSFTPFIPHRLARLASPAVISTAFTELINGAEG